MILQRIDKTTTIITPTEGCNTRYVVFEQWRKRDAHDYPNDAKAIESLEEWRAQVTVDIRLRMVTDLSGDQWVWNTVASYQEALGMPDTFTDGMTGAKSKQEHGLSSHICVILRDLALMDRARWNQEMERATRGKEDR